MSAVVVNHLHLTVPVDQLATTVAREFELVFRAQPGVRALLPGQGGARTRRSW